VALGDVEAVLPQDPELCETADRSSDRRHELADRVRPLAQMGEYADPAGRSEREQGVGH
jgi:hypothetical protein